MKAQKKSEKDFKIRYATLDDVPDLLDYSGEFEVPIRYLHKVVQSSRQGVILLEQGGEIKGYVHIRKSANGLKIDSYAFPDDEKALELLSEVESLTKDLSIYVYVDKNSEDVSIFQNAGYRPDLETDDGKIKLVKPWAKICEDREKELEYHRKALEAKEKHEEIHPRAKKPIGELQANLIRLEKIIEEMEEEELAEETEEGEKTIENGLVACTVCGKEFDSEKGMKIHRTKMHGSS